MTPIARRPGLAVFAAAFIGLAGHAHAVEFGYSVATNNHLYQIDLTTGAATDLGSVNLQSAEGMAFNGATLLGAGGPPGLQQAVPQQLWNLTTPPGSFIANTAFTTDTDAGLAARNGALWAVQGNAFGSVVAQINPATGGTIQSAFITDGFNDTYLDSLAIDSSGNAFAVDPIFSGSFGALYSLDLSGNLGLATLVGSLGITDINDPQAQLQAQSGLDFDSSDTLYLLLSDGRLYTLNTTTGAATFIAAVSDGNSPLTFHGGFAIGDFTPVSTAIVPEPATMTMVLAGAMACLMRKRGPSGRR